MATFIDSEANRIKSLKSYNVMYSEPDKTLDYLVQNLANYLVVPICYISFIDERRQWLKAKFGTTVTETSRSEAFCNFTVKSKLPLQIKNLTDHPQLKTHPAVMAENGARFYLGIPLISDTGHSIGTLCVVDLKPREFDIIQVMHLQLMATMVMSVMDAKKSADKMKLQIDMIEDTFHGSIHQLTDINQNLIEKIETCTVDENAIEAALRSSEDYLRSMEEMLNKIRTE